MKNKNKERMEEYITIIKHPSAPENSDFWSYDIMASQRRISLIEDKYNRIINSLYKVRCRFVDKFMKDNKEMLYLGSEDMGHIPEFNWISEKVNELVDKGAKLVEMKEEEE